MDRRRRHIPGNPDACLLADRNAFRELAVGALSQFSRWLSGNEANREVAGFYRSLGSERRRMGFELNEVISSLSLFRKHISTYAMQHGVYRGALDAYSALELVHRIVLFSTGRSIIPCAVFSTPLPEPLSEVHVLEFPINLSKCSLRRCARVVSFTVARALPLERTLHFLYWLKV
ncbi:MAG: hypothetical protein MZV70_58880 [Desulfobacterales bacterium]|nr:hypothetical protein [Desulfobacterales bacterium]